MNLNHLSPYIRVALDNRVEPPWTVQERVIFDYELLYVKQGRIIVTVEDKVYYGEPGDLFLFKPKQRHSISILGQAPLRQPHIHFDLFYQPDSHDVKVSFKPLEQISEAEAKWFREDISPSLPFSLPNHIRLYNPLPIENMIFDIIHEFERKMPYYEIAAKSMFSQLWIQLLREIHWRSNPHVVSNWEELHRVKNFLNHQTNQEISLDELSALANLSKYYLCRLFKNAFGMTPIQYHLTMRLEKAKEMIQFTDTPLSHIAELFGFDSIHAFSRAFRKSEGVPPSFYRKKK